MGDDTHYDHPIPVGSILKAPNYDHLYKVIVGVRKSEVGTYWVYETYTTRSNASEPYSQTELDLETMASSDEYTDWDLLYRNDSDNSENQE